MLQPAARNQATLEEAALYGRLDRAPAFTCWLGGATGDVRVNFTARINLMILVSESLIVCFHYLHLF